MPSRTRGALITAPVARLTYPGDITKRPADTAGQPQTLVEHFDGTAWGIIASPTRDLAQHLNGVFSLPHSNNVWTVGASAPFGVQVESGLLQAPLTLVLFTPIG